MRVYKCGKVLAGIFRGFIREAIEPIPKRLEAFKSREGLTYSRTV
jgi:hypothetical protein